MTDQSSSCRTLLVPTIILHKERAEHTQILMSSTRPTRPQLQRTVSGLLYKDLWVHFLNTRERLSIFHQVRVAPYQAPCLDFLVPNVARELWWTLWAGVQRIYRKSKR